MVGKIRLTCREDALNGEHRLAADGVTCIRCHAEIRHLVVINPEDREQVKRLATLFAEKVGSNTYDDLMAVALREFANPMTVLTHYPAEVRGDGVVLSLCGKLWQPSAHAVSEGKCETCAALVESGWVK